MIDTFYCDSTPFKRNSGRLNSLTLLVFLVWLCSCGQNEGDKASKNNLSLSPNQNAAIASIDSALIKVTTYNSTENDSTLILSKIAYSNSDELGYELGKAKALTQSGIFLVRQFRLDTAYQCLSASATIYEENQMFGDSAAHGFAKTLNGLGFYYNYKSDFEKGDYYLNQALEIYKSVADTPRIRNVNTSLGVNRGMQDKYAEALAFFLVAYQLNPDSITASTLMNNIALCYFKMGHIRLAAKYYKEGLAIDIENDWKPQIYKLNNLVEVYQNLNQIDSAIYFGKLGLTAAKRFKDASNTAIAMANLAQQYVLLEEFNLAEDYANEAQKIADSVGVTSVIPSLDYVRASILYNKGNYDSMLLYGRRAISTALNNSNKFYASTLAKQLSDGFSKIGNSDSTIYYLKLHHAMEDSLFNKKNQRAFTELYAKMETLEKQQEIEMLQKQQEIDAANKFLLIISTTGIIALLVAGILIVIYRSKNKQKKQRIAQMQMTQEMGKKEMELQQQTLHMINLNNSISEVEQKLKEVKKKDTVSKQDVQRVLSNISVSKSMGEEWNKFESYFANNHPKFSSELMDKHSNLSRQERRLISLIKMDMSNREIANLLNIEPRSVSMNKYRLKQKLGLTENDDLDGYINQIFGDRKN